MNQSALVISLFVVFCQGSYASNVLHFSDWESAASLTYSTKFGATEVVSSGSNSELLFNTFGNSPSFYYDQIEFVVSDEPEGRYLFEFDIRTENLIGSTNDFVILFDVPGSERIELENDGDIRTTSPFCCNLLTTFTDGQTLDFDILMDSDRDSWSIWMNGTNLYDGRIGAAVNKLDIRFSLGLSLGGLEPDHSTNVYLDNVAISTSEIPLPISVSLYLSALVVLFFKKCCLQANTRS